MTCDKCNGSGLISSYEVCSKCKGTGNDGTQPVEVVEEKKVRKTKKK